MTGTPHDIDAETDVLAVLVTNPGLIARALDHGLDVDDFYRPAHVSTWQVLVDLDAAGQPITSAAVAAKVDALTEPEIVGWYPTHGHSVSIESYIDTLKEVTDRRVKFCEGHRLLMEAGVNGEPSIAIEGSDDDFDRMAARIEAGDVRGVDAPDLVPESWQRVDLGPALRGEVQTVVPTLLRRDDGPGLFYAGRVNEVHAADGIGKTWAALVATGQELEAGHNVMWIDYEEPDATTAVTRLRMLGRTDEQISSGFHYHSPKDPTSLLALDLLAAEIAAGGIGLVVIDSLGEAFGLDGINEDRDNEVGPWLRRVARTLADTGAAVILIDHTTKSNDNPLHPSGSKRKRAAVTGASYMVEAVQPLTRDQGGRLRLTCAKDRHGHYRRGEVAGEIVLTVYPDSGMTVHVNAVSTDSDEPDAKLTAVARAAVRAVKDADSPPSKRVVVELMKVKAARDRKLAAIEYATDKGAIRGEPAAKNATIYHYVRDL